MSRLKLAICAALCMLGIGTASAALFERGPDMVYDDVLDITWTRQAGDGVLRNWSESVTWANDLVFGGFDGWRLPWASVSAQAGPVTSMVDCSTATETACRDNEMGYMFYHNLGGTLFQNKTGIQTALGGEVLSGIQLHYWSSAEFDSFNEWAWMYKFTFGVQDYAGESVPLSAWAVHDGDVAAIPEPEIYAMLGLGLGLMGWVGRRRKLKVA